MTNIEMIAQLQDIVMDRRSLIVDEDENEWNYILLHDIEAINTAIVALKKQMPQRLKIDRLQTNIQGYLCVDKCCVCPSCGNFRGNLECASDRIQKYDFCPDCGQALDWSEIK